MIAVKTAKKTELLNSRRISGTWETSFWELSENNHSLADPNKILLPCHFIWTITAQPVDIDRIPLVSNILDHKNHHTFDDTGPKEGKKKIHGFGIVILTISKENIWLLGTQSSPQTLKTHLISRRIMPLVYPLVLLSHEWLIWPCTSNKQR